MKKIIALSILFLFFSFAAEAEVSVVINEVAWMGNVVSSNDEWIELKNFSDAEVDLAGWSVKAADGSPVIKLEKKIPAHGFLILERSDDESAPGVAADQIYTGALVDSGERLGLYDNNDALIDEIDAVGGWMAGDKNSKRTMERSQSGWQSSEAAGGTPRAENSSGYIAPAPAVVEKKENETGAAAENTSSVTSPASAPDAAKATGTASSFSKGPVEEFLFNDAMIVISEFLPNPIGADGENEWVEVRNASAQKVNLLGWKIAAGGKSLRDYVVEQDVWLDSGEFFVIEHDESKLTLNNTAGTVKIINPQGSTTSEVKYAKTFEGLSCVNQEGSCFWSVETTPGEANVLSAKELDSPSARNPIPSTSSTKKTAVKKAAVKSSASSASKRLIMKAQVTALPGSLGRQYFYVDADDGGWQVYKYDGKFPKLSLGDYLQITGEQSEAVGGRRIKIGKNDTIKVLSHEKPLLPEIISCDALAELNFGTLVRISGAVTDKKASYLYVDDGNDEVKVYGKKTAGIGFGKFKEGDEVEVSGILEIGASETKILPRTDSDIILKKSGSSEKAQVLGTSTADAEWTLEQEQDNWKNFGYSAVSLLALGMGGFIYYKKKI